jgi:hypothetical protein
MKGFESSTQIGTLPDSFRFHLIIVRENIRWKGWYKIIQESDDRYRSRVWSCWAYCRSEAVEKIFKKLTKQFTSSGSHSRTRSGRRIHRFGSGLFISGPKSGSGSQIDGIRPSAAPWIVAVSETHWVITDRIRIFSKMTYPDSLGCLTTVTKK